MYYYITETSKNSYERKIQERIKFILGDLGIAGETVNVSPARPVKEAVKMGLLKGYKTMVAVGSDWLANQVASCLCGRDVTLGLIPFRQDQEITAIIKTGYLKKACEALKYRRVETMNLGFIEPSHFFLTPARISENKSTSAEINFKNWKTQVKISDIEIDNNLNLKIWDKKDLAGSFSDIFYWLIGKNPKNNKNDVISAFSADNFRVTTSQIFPLKVSGKIIAKTPFVARLASGVLPIIIYRDKIKKDE